MNPIPAIKAGGQFTAQAPFDQVVNPNTYYTVEAVRTVAEMEGLKLNLYQLVYQPVGAQEADYANLINGVRNAGGVIITLLSRNNPPVYVPSTSLLSFPLVDGVSYERMCLIVDIGACPPGMKDVLAQAQAHIQQYILDTVGVDNQVRLGTIPTIGYVSRQQAEAYENTRQSRITNTGNDVARIRELTGQLATRDAYILQLEQQLGVVPQTP